VASQKRASPARCDDSGEARGADQLDRPVSFRNNASHDCLQVTVPPNASEVQIDTERDERRVLATIAKHSHAFRDRGLTADAFQIPLHREAFGWLGRFPEYVEPNPGPLRDLILELRAKPAEPIPAISSIVMRTIAAAAARCADQYRSSADYTHRVTGQVVEARHAAQRSIGSRPRSSGQVTSGDVLKKEQNQLRGELRVFIRWTQKDGGTVTDAELESFINQLRTQFEPRDPLDPNCVSPQELGGHFRLTFARRKQIEDSDTERRADWHKRWPNRYRKPQRFRFHKFGVDPADMSPEQVAARYKAERSKSYNAKRRAARQHKRDVMRTIQTTMNSRYVPYDVRLTRNGMQRESLYDAITAENMTVASLMTAMKCDPAWLGVPNAKLYRTVLNRLDKLEGEGRIYSWLVSGRNGSRLRLVNRI
jgi:hypothetical protein